jgi:hypothetical protein
LNKNKTPIFKNKEETMQEVYIIRHIEGGYLDGNTGVYGEFLYATEYKTENDAKSVVFENILHEVEIVKLYVYR